MTARGFVEGRRSSTPPAKITDGQIKEEDTRHLTRAAKAWVASEVASADLRARANAILAGTAPPEMPHKPDLHIIDPTLPPLQKVPDGLPPTYRIPEGHRPQAYIPEQHARPSDPFTRPSNDPPITSVSWPKGDGPDEGF
jgi:hypothetical protein